MKVPQREEGGGYTFFWKGKPQAEDRIHGVGFAIRTALIKSLSVLPVGISVCLMKLRITHSKSRHVMVISVYAPMLTSPDDTKEQFCEHLDQVIKSTSQNDKIVILGDFNARVGRDYNGWKGVLGRHGIGKVNDNGQLLLSKCAEHGFCITNTLFRIANKYKATWMHPRSKHWYLINFIIVHQYDIRVIHVPWGGVEYWTDNRLLWAILTLYIPPLHRK